MGNHRAQTLALTLSKSSIINGSAFSSHSSRLSDSVLSRVLAMSGSSVIEVRDIGWVISGDQDGSAGFCVGWLGGRGAERRSANRNRNAEPAVTSSHLTATLLCSTRTLLLLSAGAKVTSLILDWKTKWQYTYPERGTKRFYDGSGNIDLSAVGTLRTTIISLEAFFGCRERPQCRLGNRNRWRRY